MITVSNSFNYLLSFEVSESQSVCPFQTAVETGDVEGLKKIIYKTSEVNTPMKNGHLPLHVAVRKGHVGVISLLIERGADSSLLDADGLSALDYAAMNPIQGVLEALLASSRIKNVSQKASQFVFAKEEEIAKTQGQIQEIKQELFKNIDDPLSRAIHNRDYFKVEKLIKNGSIKIESTHILRAIFMRETALVAILLNAFRGRPARLIENLLHIAAHENHAPILKILVNRGGDLQRKNSHGVSPADLLFKSGAKNDPLHVSKAQVLLTLFGLSTIFYENLVEPVLSPQTAALLQGALLFFSCSTELALTYQVYTQVNPETLFEKAFFWASSMATMPIQMGIARIPLLKTSWDLWRCYHVATQSFKGLERSYRHYSYDQSRSLQYASMQVLTVGSTFYHCRKTAARILKMIDGYRSPTAPAASRAPFRRTQNRVRRVKQPKKPPLRSRKLSYRNPPRREEPVHQAQEKALERKVVPEQVPAPVAAEPKVVPEKASAPVTEEPKDLPKKDPFCCVEKTQYDQCKSNPIVRVLDTERSVLKKVHDFKNSRYKLKGDVRNALTHGGRIEAVPDTTNGQYKIFDGEGRVIALFKPENERRFGPEHLKDRRPNPTSEDIHFHKMDSFEQGMYTERQYLSKMLDHGSSANLPYGTIVEMESDLFTAPEGGSGPQCKRGYLQEWLPQTKKVSEATLSDGAELRRVPLNEFQKLGIMDVQLYNQDRHMGNTLLTEDGKHLVNVDADSVLPWKLENNNNPLLKLPRASEPFTEESLALIRRIDPKLHEDLAKGLGLPKQAATNARILAMVLQRFTEAGKSLHDIGQFIGSDKRDVPSELWKKVEEAQKASLEALTQKEREQYDYFKYLRWALWWHKKNENKEWYQDYQRYYAKRIDSKIESAFWAKMSDTINQFLAKDKKITFGTTYLPGNQLRDEMSVIVDANHKEFAAKWGLVHETVAENRLKGQCTVHREKVDCSPYWNKIKVLRDWLSTPVADKNYEEWRVMADDDMVVTNMKVNPYKAIDQLRMDRSGRMRDTSVIVAKDVSPYTGNPVTSVNTGLLLVRKDDSARKIIDRIWEWRNNPAPRATSFCPTLGVCEKQHTLHEQQALSNMIRDQRSLVGTQLSVVDPRDKSHPHRGHIALNTFERSGYFARKVPGWESEHCFQYHDPESGKWSIGDWMSQTAGVPVLGRFCNNNKPSGPLTSIRKGKIENMLAHVVR